MTPCLLLMAEISYYLDRNRIRANIGCVRGATTPILFVIESPIDGQGRSSGRTFKFF